MKLKLIIGLMLCMGISAQAQSTWYSILAGDIKTFFTDNTNLFNQGPIQFELGPVANINNAQFGFDFNAQFPIAQQASIGFDVFYYGGHVYDGTFNTTLGTTWTIWNQPIYTYTSIGVGTDLQSASSIINIEWVGAKTQWTIKQNLIKQGDSLSAGLDVGAGHVSNIIGTLAKVEGMLTYTF